MTPLLTLSADIRQNEIFKEKSGIFARICTLLVDQNIFLSEQEGRTGRARTFMSRIATRASSLINSFIFVLCH